MDCQQCESIIKGCQMLVHTSPMDGIRARKGLFQSQGMFN